MEDSSLQRFQFGLTGMVSKQDPSLLSNGQYQSILNMEVVQEGSISTAAGRRFLGSVGSGLVGYMIAKMTINPRESAAAILPNPRYVGVYPGFLIYRTLDYVTFTQVASDVNTLGSYQLKRFSISSYAIGNSGSSWAFIASELKMLKDNGYAPYGTLRRWGILPAFGTAVAADNGAGLLDGGAASSPPEATAYDYRYCYVGNDTNNKGNPSQTMLADNAYTQAGFSGDGLAYAGIPISVHLKKVKVLVYGTDDPQITQIAIYRRGGLLFDAWRIVGLVTNPGLGNQAVFADNIADVDLENAEQMEFDNDPPVPSKAPVPIGGAIAGPVGPGRAVVTTTAGTLANVTVGSSVSLFADAPEVVVIESIAGATFTAFLQHTQPAGTAWEVDTIVGQPCNLVISFGQWQVVAGDPNNPHILYRSKGDFPESFPVTPADGSVATAAAGTPTNPILNLCEFRGQIVTLNKSSLFETFIVQGSFVTPFEATKRGVVGVSAWCKTPTEIWFRSTDGIWSWDGGNCTKRSQQIDTIFRGQQYNGIPPASDDANFIGDTVMESHRGEIHVLYWDASGTRQRLICEPDYGDRWRLFKNGGGASGYIFGEDTGNLIEIVDTPGLPILVDDSTVAAGGANYTSDGYTTDPTSQGSPIQFDMELPWFDFGDPHSNKVITELYLDVDASLANPSQAAVTADVLVDFSSTVKDSTTLVLPTAGRALVPLTCGVTTPRPMPVGREARVFSFHIYGEAFPTRITFFALVIRYKVTGTLTAGGTLGDWMNMGHKFDKKLYQLTVEFDVSGVDQILAMDTMSGRDGKTYTEGAELFTLSNPVISGAGRALKSFPVADRLVVKEVRLRSFSSLVYFKVINVDFEKEDYPADVTAFTPVDDGGYEYDKYLNQIDLSVNTNGVDVTVQVQVDGTDVAHTVFTFVVNTTDAARRFNVTCPPNLRGKLWRLFIDTSQPALVSGAGMFQLFYQKGIFKFQPADRGEIIHTADWDDLGHPWDKYLSTVTFEWDLNGAAGTVTLQLDLLFGINGQNVAANVAQFALSGGRGKRVFPLAADMIAKMIRIYPSGAPPIGYKQWKYTFDKIDYPADTITSTPWRDAESPNDKNPSWVSVDADTAGIPAVCSLQNEFGTVLTFQHTGTLTNRKKDYAVPADQIGKMWRLLASAGLNGKFQLFTNGLSRWHAFDQAGPEDPPDVVLWTPWTDFGYPYGKLARNIIMTVNTGGFSVPVHLQTQEAGTVQTFFITTTYTTRRVVLPCLPELIGTQWRLLIDGPLAAGVMFKLWDWALDHIKEPAAVTSWSSYQQTFGYKGWKFIKQGWWMYQCATPVTLTITSDTGVLSVTLPPHAGRSEERFLLPTKWGAGLNKSTVYAVTLTAAAPFKFYPEGSGFEFLAIGADRHAAYQMTTFSEFMGLGEGA